jgi:hypothetical protein
VWGKLVGVLISLKHPLRYKYLLHLLATGKSFYSHIPQPPPCFSFRPLGAGIPRSEAVVLIRVDQEYSVFVAAKMWLVQASTVFLTASVAFAAVSEAFSVGAHRDLFVVWANLSNAVAFV